MKCNMLLVAHLQLEFNTSSFIIIFFIYVIYLHFYLINAIFCLSIGTSSSSSSFLHSYISKSILFKFLPFVCVMKVCFVYWLKSVQRKL